MSGKVTQWLMMVVVVALALSLAVLPAASASAPQVADTEQVNAKIREEGWENSQVMRTLHFLTDRYGPG